MTSGEGVAPFALSKKNYSNVVACRILGAKKGFIGLTHCCQLDTLASFVLKR
jgi:hypothetical protein